MLMSNKGTILVVDDNRDIRDMLQLILEQAGYVVKRAKNAVNALRKAKKSSPHLILVDIMMPGEDGIALCRRLRSSLHKPVRIVLLTACSDEASEVAAFEAGADDFIGKPIKSKALIHRINALLQRKATPVPDAENQPPPRVVLNVGGFCIDPNRYCFHYQEKSPVILRPREFELLYFLAQHPEHYFSRETLMSQVWGTDIYVTPRTVDVHIHHIREKIGDSHISTRKGLGYAFKV